MNDSSDGSLIPELPHYLKVNATLFCSIILLIGVFGNLLVPLVIWKNKDMRNSTNLFLVNLSVADLLVLLVCMPTSIVETHSEKPEVWILGEGMCKAVSFLEMTVAHGSMLTILAISLERYYAICKPLTAGYKLTKLRAVVMIVLLWIVAIIATSPVLFITEYTTRLYVDNEPENFCLTEVKNSFWRKMYFISVICVLFFLPLLILIIIYGIITRHLMMTPCVMGTRLDTSNMRARKQVVMMLAAVVIFFFVCLMPMRVFMLWIIFTEDVENIGLESYYNLLYFCRIMLYINSAINPILYNVMSSKFREAFFRVLGCPKRDHRRLDRQTTFSTTYTSLYSSLKGRVIDRTSSTTSTSISTPTSLTHHMLDKVPSNGHFIRQNSSQDSAV